MFHLLIIFILFTLLIYFIGATIHALFIKTESKKFESIFSSLVFGIVALVTIFSILVTTFKTVFVIVPLIFLLYYFFYGKETFILNKERFFLKLQKLFELENILILIGVSIAPFLFQYYSLFESYNSAFPIRIVNSDYIFYSKISEYLLTSGEENSWQVHNTILKEFNGTTPYHYFNEWIVAFLIKFSSGKSIYLQEIVTFSFTTTLGIFGITSLLEYFKARTNFFDVILCTLCMFFKFIITFHILSGIDFFATNSLSMHKVSILYIFVIFSFLHILHKRFNIAFLFLSLLPIFYFVPAVLSGVVVTNIFLLQLPKKDRIKNIAISFAVALLFGVFYWITRNSMDQDALNRSLDMSTYSKTFVNIIGGTFLQILVLCTPFIFIFFVNLYLCKIKLKNFIEAYSIIAILTFSIVVSAVVCWAALNFLPDSVQLFQNIAIVVLNVAFLSLFFFLFSKNVVYAYLTLTLIISANLYQTKLQHYENQFYSNEYLKYIENTLAKNLLNPTGVCLFGAENYEAKNYDYYINHKFSVNKNTSILGAQLKYIKNYFNLVCISTHDIPTFSDPFIENIVKNSCFHRYLKKKNFSNLEEAKLQFINEYKINYVIASKFADIEFLKNEVKNVFIDINTQEKFIILK